VKIGNVDIDEILVNTATIVNDIIEVTGSNNIFVVTTGLIARADVMITKTVNTLFPVVEQLFSYTLSYTNAGP
jgi:hypothetical protein